ncbi:TMEM164 family acyltransferase [Mycoplasma sp. Z386]
MQFLDFFNWRRNVVTFAESKILFYSIFALILLATTFVWIYKSKIYNHFNSNPDKKYLKNLNKDQLFMVIGAFVIIFNIFRIILFLVRDYPWKWELIPLHLCRFYIVYFGFIFLFKKAHNIKYISILAFLGGIVGFLFVNLGPVPEFINQDRIYNSFQPGTIEYERAGFDSGYDTYAYWDFILTHGFVIFIPVLTHIAYGKKAKINITVITQGLVMMLILGIVIFFVSWIMYEILQKIGNPKLKIALDPNWLYLGRTGIGTLGKLTRWPLNIVTLSVLVPLLTYLAYFIYVLLSSIEFDNFNEKNKNPKIKFRKPREVFQEQQDWTFFKKIMKKETK